MKLLGRIVGGIALLLVAFLMLAPREPIGGAEMRLLPPGEPAERVASVIAAERLIKDIRPGAEKEVVWAGPEMTRTKLAVVYIHGFSATKEETRPLPDDVAKALGANLFLTRMTGHGRTGKAMAQATVQAWMEDFAEAMAAGEALGERTLVIATSTGATVAALATLTDSAVDGLPAGAPGAKTAAAPRRAGVMAHALGLVFVSPNFGLQDPAARVLTLPFARAIAPLIAGETRSWAPRNEEHGRWWTTSYPTEALVPMAAAVDAASSLPYGSAPPALFILSDDDKVVDPAAAREVAARWGAGGAEVMAVTPGPDDDPDAHVIAGRIMSPGLTAPVAERIVAWAEALLAEEDRREAERAAKEGDGG